MKHKGRRRYQEKQKGKVTKEVEERKSKIKQFGVFFLMIYPRSAFIFGQSRVLDRLDNIKQGTFANLNEYLTSKTG